MRARERKRESKRERDKCLEAEKMKENEMSKGFFFFFLNVMGRAGLNLDIFCFWLNGAQWVFN